MSDDLTDLYQEVILDHGRNPRNFRIMADATATAEGLNPLCGDRYHVFLKMEGDRIADVSFQGTGCAISKASASLMSAAVKGRTVAEAEALEMAQPLPWKDTSAIRSPSTLRKMR